MDFLRLPAYLRSMFSTIKALVGELHGINLRLKDLIELQRLQGPADDRLQELELSRATWEAEIEGVLLKAEGREKAARSAEARTRTMKRHYEDESDFGDPDSAEEPEAVPLGYAPTSAEEQMHHVHVGMAEDYKTQALRAKFS